MPCPTAPHEPKVTLVKVPGGSASRKPPDLPRGGSLARPWLTLSVAASVPKLAQWSSAFYRNGGSNDGTRRSSQIFPPNGLTRSSASRNTRSCLPSARLVLSPLLNTWFVRVSRSVRRVRSVARRQRDGGCPVIPTHRRRAGLVAVRHVRGYDATHEHRRLRSMVLERSTLGRTMGWSISASVPPPI